MARRKKEADVPALEPVDDPEDRAELFRDAKGQWDMLMNTKASRQEEVKAKQQLVKVVEKQIADLFRRVKMQTSLNRDDLEDHFNLLNIEDEDVRAARLAARRELYRALPLGEQAELFPEDTGEHAAGIIHEPGTNGDEDASAGFTFEQGKQAGLAGKTAGDNPFAKRLKAHHTWEAGRMSGQAELAHDMDPATGTAPEPAESERRPRGRRSAAEAPAGTA